MKAISIKQPWANLIAEGKKTIETRTWPTNHRGRILIVSSKIPNIAPAGQALAIANLTDCRRMKRGDEDAAKCPWCPELYSWILSGVVRIRPFPVKGRPGIYETEERSYTLKGN